VENTGTHLMQYRWTSITNGGFL